MLCHVLCNTLYKVVDFLCRADLRCLALFNKVSNKLSTDYLRNIRKPAISKVFFYLFLGKVKKRERACHHKVDYSAECKKIIIYHGWVSSMFIRY